MTNRFKNQINYHIINSERFMDDYYFADYDDSWSLFLAKESQGYAEDMIVLQRWESYRLEEKEEKDNEEDDY